MSVRELLEVWSEASQVQHDVLQALTRRTLGEGAAGVLDAPVPADLVARLRTAAFELDRAHGAIDAACRTRRELQLRASRNPSGRGTPDESAE